MNKLKIAFLVAFAGGLIALTIHGQQKNAEAAFGQSELIGGSEGMYSTRIFSTGTKVFDGAGTVYRIDISSGNNGVTQDYLVLIDTDASGNGFGAPVTIATGSFASSAIVFNATGTTNMDNFKDYTPYGIRINKGLYVLKSVAQSGQAFTANIYWRP